MMTIIISEYLVSEPFLAVMGNGILCLQREVSSSKEGNQPLSFESTTGLKGGL